MIKLLPLLLIALGALALWKLSATRLQAMLRARSTPLRAPELTAALAPLAQALGLPQIPLRVYQVPEINGLAAPDGQVYLTQGFMARYQSGEISAPELASVVAHELGHVALGHARRRMIDFTGQSLLRLLVIGILARFAPLVGVWLGNLLTAALAAKLSRRAEFEADEWAAALMIKSGYGVGPQVSLLAKLNALTGAQGPQGGTAWLATHPATAERIAAIQAQAAAWTARN